MAAEVTAGSGVIRRWAAAHAATVARPAVGAAWEPVGTSAPELPREPVPAVLAAFTEVRTLPDAATRQINRVAWALHPDGRLLLATAGIDQIARIWDADTGRELHTLTGHTDVIGKAEWGRARDGQLLLATGSYDGTARIWDPDTGECLHTLISHPEGRATFAGVSVAWGAGPDGSSVLATGDKNGVIRIWDPGTGQELSAFGDEQPDRGSDIAEIFSMAWATGADGQARLATGGIGGGMLRVWDPLTTHQPPEKPPPDPASPWHTHLPPAPTQAQLTTAIGRLLAPGTENGG